MREVAFLEPEVLLVVVDAKGQPTPILEALP